MVKFGVCLYTIGLDGCLNGFYTNECGKNEISNEDAKLKEKYEDFNDRLSGIYDCYYFQPDKNNNYVELVITKSGNNMYNLIWKDNDKEIFRGVGYIITENQFLVRYESVK